MEIKDIKLSTDDNAEDFLVKWKDLSANVYDDTRFFWAESFDGQYACSGMIVDAFENVDNENPTLCVMRVFKLTQTIFKLQEPEPVEPHICKPEVIRGLKGHIVGVVCKICGKEL